MVGKQLVQLRKLRNDIGFGTPVHRGSIVHPDLLRCKPFGAAGETESAGGAGESAKSIAKQGPSSPLRGKAVIIMCLTVMDQQADARVLAQAMIEVPGDCGTGVVLEQLGVGPLHP